MNTLIAQTTTTNKNKKIMNFLKYLRCFSSILNCGVSKPKAYLASADK